jgi:flavin reductase (DIM6/NTAB) family NADH-FMN oxidoreductase RutF
MSSESSSRPETPVTATEFRQACGRFATGITIASVLDETGTPHGLTVNSFSSVSLDPPLVLVCLGHVVTAIEIFRAARHFGLNVLAANQRELSQRFATKDCDKFDGLSWHRGTTGVPLLPHTLAEIECAVERIVPAGDHDIFIAEMVHVRLHEGEPLIYFGGRYRELG